jgi:thiamine biosynthesis protein ThiI
MELVLSAACSEISLKGRNRPHFEALLMRNMRVALSPYGKFEMRERGGRILAVPKDGADAAAGRAALASVFGIDNVSLAAMVAPKMEDIESHVSSIAGSFAGKSIRVETRRSDKRFPLTSQEVSRRAGAAFVKAGCSVDLKTPQQTIYIDIMGDCAIVSDSRARGPGGMPVGASGRVLSLLSGGIDSPVASWMMMKRGCSVDLLHVHSSARNSEVSAADSKMMRLARAIRGFSPLPMRLTLAPYTEFYKKAMAIDQRFEVVLFRRFMLRLACAVARKGNSKGIVTGDSIAQVASQTLENIYATDGASDMPVFRPLAAFNKQETIDIAERIGTYKISLEPYKDCCSLVSSRNPSTSVRLEKAQSLEEEIGMTGIVEKTLEESATVEI